MIATEGGHWYERDGTPAYEVLGRNGEMRPTTKRDARRLGLVPSVSGIMKCAASPALINYFLDQAYSAAANFPREEDESEAAYKKRLKSLAGKHSSDARDLGTAIHACIEKQLGGFSYNPDYKPHVDGALAALEEWCGPGPYCAEKSFAHQLGYGGKVDVHKDDGFGFVADFKSKDFDESKLPETYDNHAIQLAAYREGLWRQPRASCAIIFVSTKVPGLTHTVEVHEDELARGWRMFRCLLEYWQVQNRFELVEA